MLVSIFMLVSICW